MVCFEKAIEFDPLNSAAMYNLANTHYVLENHDKAAEYFEKAILLEPGNTEWHNYIGGVYFGKNDFKNARKHLEESYKLNAENIDTNYRMAQLNHAEAANENALQFINVKFDIFSFKTIFFFFSLCFRTNLTTKKQMPLKRLS